MQASTYKVQGLVSEIRRRWRRRALMQGAALTLLTLLFFATMLLLVYTNLAVRPAYLAAAAVVAGVVVLGVLVQFVLRPAFRRISDRQIALFVEEKIPDLEDRLNSAVEVGDTAGLRDEHGVLLDRLLDDAAHRTKAIPVATVIDRRRERILAYTAGAFLLAFLVFGYSSLDAIRFTEAGMDLSGLTAAAQPYLTVDPGNAELEKGASQEIIVHLREDDGHEMVLVYREGDGAWLREPMQKGMGESPTFLQEFLNIQAPIQYYVEYGDVRSDPYTLSIYEFPDVTRIDVTYHYPSYTGLPARTEEDTGDIRGLKGSTVDVTIQATGTAEAAELVLDDDRTVALESLGDGRFRGRLPLEDPHLYTVRLTDAQDKHNKFPDEYRIVPVEDEKPYVTVTDPQRDVRANAIEEVLVAAEVQDDFGVKDLRLVFSVNGGEEQTLRLMPEGAERPTETAGDHLFFLEDYSLEPGDVISYYVEAEDYFHEGSEATDMYFIEVIPFDQEFRQAANQGGMAGGQPSGIVLNQQQIIAATWTLIRERDEMTDDEVDEARRGLVQAQTNLKANIEERINSTAFSLELRGNDEQQQVVENLRKAVGEMDKAVVELGADALKDALTPERRALNFLLKADALNKENQVAMNRGGQGGGGGATEERMTELMDLELDIAKDKYEMQQQRSSQQQQEQEVDEALAKIQELARRQQNVANQSRQEELEGEDKKRFIDKLKRDQEELRQQTEQMANAMRQMSRGNEQLSRDMEERLERVADNMREAERELRREEVDRAMSRQQQALNDLEALERDLRMASQDNAREMVEDLARSFDQFREQEQQLARDIEKTSADARTRRQLPDAEALDRLVEKRERMIENLQRLTDEAEAVEERVRQEDPELAQALRNALQQMERDRLEANMLKSEEALDQGWLDYADRLESEIMSAVEALESQRRAFESTLPVTEEDQLARSLDDVRDLMRQLQDMQAQARQNQQGQPQNRQGQPQDQQGQPQNQQGQPQNQQEQPQDQQSQAQNQQNQAQNAQGGGGQPSDRQARADAARQQRQLDRAQETLERLQRDFEGNQQAMSRLRQVQSALARADHTGTRLEGEAAEAYFNDRVYDPLSQLELDIARQLDTIAMEKKLFGSRRADVPAAYRDLVEKYYEALSKDGGR